MILVLGTFQQRTARTNDYERLMGTPWLGALYMILFGMGTIPLMTTAIFFTSFLKGTARRKIQQLIPVFVVLIGILFIIRGLGLGIPYVSPATVTEVVTSTIDCH